MEDFVVVDSNKIIRILSADSSCSGCHFSIYIEDTDSYSCARIFNKRIDKLVQNSKIGECLEKIDGNWVEFIYVESGN